MLTIKEQRIRDLQNKVSDLKKENISLRKRNQELSDRIMQMKKIVAAAEKYSDEHREAMYMISVAKNKYEEAIRDLTLLRKQYNL